MKRIVALVGVRGAGKTTLIASLKSCENVSVLLATTDRPRRGADDKEYDFCSEFPHGNKMAWHIKVGEYSYGVTKERIKQLPEGSCGITPFYPGGLDALNAYGKSWTGEIVTIGLDTISTPDEQIARVGGDQGRRMTNSEFVAQRERVLGADIVLRGNQETLLAATKAVCEILLSRGGLVGKNSLAPLIEAGALLENARASEIQPASYDLRLGDELWCQGKLKKLTDDDLFFSIPPYSYAIVKAEEVARVPCFMTGRFDLKVSLFFKGVLLSNGPQVDPGYYGPLFCMLFNGTDVHLNLKKGEHFATLEFCTLGTRVDGYAGQYQNKIRLGDFQGPDAGAGPGGNIVGRIEKLEVNSVGRSLLVAGIVFALIATPAAYQLWLISEFKDRSGKAVEQAASDAEREIEAVSSELSRKVDEALRSLSKEAVRIDRFRADLDAIEQRAESLSNGLERLEGDAGRPPVSKDGLLPSITTEPNQ